MGDRPLTDRQRRELEYHARRATTMQHLLDEPISWEVLDNPALRWWNAYWTMWAYLMRAGVSGKRALVVGCGYGLDALRLAKAGAKVSGFDLSEESLAIGRALAAREGLTVDFDQMPAETLLYPNDSFDLVLAVDIFHHVDIDRAVPELTRVARSGALVVVNEIYSHTITDVIRRSAIVDKAIYPMMRRWIYGTDSPYITEDERKLTQNDIAAIYRHLQPHDMRRYFNALVTRIVPDTLPGAAAADRAMLAMLGPAGSVLAGRILFSARVP